MKKTLLILSLLAVAVAASAGSNVAAPSASQPSVSTGLSANDVSDPPIVIQPTGVQADDVSSPPIIIPPMVQGK